VVITPGLNGHHSGRSEPEPGRERGDKGRDLLWRRGRDQPIHLHEDLSGGHRVGPVGVTIMGAGQPVLCPKALHHRPETITGSPSPRDKDEPTARKTGL